MNPFQHAHFLLGVAHTHDLPPPTGFEVAFAGRSNAGKSSAINVLVNRSRLAYVSKTPGRTQQINFYGLGEDRYLVDLPGYGFAGVPLEIKRHWHELVGEYVAKRPCLRGVVLIMDSRHPMTPLDRQLIEWVGKSGLGVHVLLSKCDKLSRSVQQATLRTVRAELLPYGNDCSAQLFSSLDRTGLDEARDRVAQMFGLSNAQAGLN